MGRKVIERKLIRIATAVGAAWWLARLMLSRSERRKLDLAMQALDSVEDSTVIRVASKADLASLDANVTRMLGRMKMELVRWYVGSMFLLACLVVFLVKYTHR